MLRADLCGLAVPRPPTHPAQVPVCPCAHIPPPPRRSLATWAHPLSAHGRQARVIPGGGVPSSPRSPTHPSHLPPFCTRSLSASTALPAPALCSLAGVCLPLDLLSLRHVPSPISHSLLLPLLFLSLSCAPLFRQSGPGGLARPPRILPGAPATPAPCLAALSPTARCPHPAAASQAGARLAEPGTGRTPGAGLRGSKLTKHHCVPGSGQGTAGPL